MMYLYVKTHNITGLKYLGYTKRLDPNSYPGSGIRWKRHLRKHGADYNTVILLVTEDHSELKETGIFFSKLWNVVESDDWANMCPEEGQGGNTGDYTGRQLKAKQTMLDKYGVEHNSQIKSKMSASLVKRKETMKAKYGVENYSQTANFVTTYDKIKQTTKERYGVENAAASPEIKLKVRETRLSDKWIALKHKTCEHCGKTLEPGNFSRWHGDKCKMKKR